MTVCNPISTCSKNVVCLVGNAHRRTMIRVSDGFLQLPNCYYSFGKHSRIHYAAIYPTKASWCSPINGFHAFQRSSFLSGTSNNTSSSNLLTFKSTICPRRHRRIQVNVSTGDQNLNLRFLVSKQSQTSKIWCNIGPFSWQQRSLSSGLFIGLLVCFSTPQPSYAEAPDASARKKVLSDYSVIGIPGDGRCLFRSVAHGACIRAGKPAPDETLQMKLSDELRARVADEFIRRREETEWFIEGDFDRYVSQMRKPHIWGGEPELLMASHVLRAPITVYMYDENSNGLISIAEYGQEYGKDNPILVLYHGYGHYDALHVPGKGGARPRL